MSLTKNELEWKLEKQLQAISVTRRYINQIDELHADATYAFSDGKLASCEDLVGEIQWKIDELADELAEMWNK